MKTVHIIKREYLENVKKKGFIISTILAPVFLVVIYAIPILLIFFDPSEQVSLAVLDRTQLVGQEFIESLSDTLKDGRQRYVISDTGDDGRDFDRRKELLVSMIKNDALDVLVEIPEDALETGRIDYISKNYFNEVTTDQIRDRISPIVISHRFTQAGMDYETVASLNRRINLNENKITKSGVLEESELVGEYAMVTVFVMILYMTLLTWGMSVQRSIIEEKSSRVIEVMLSSVEPRDLFFGKVLGVGSLGLTQVALWSVMMLGLGFSSSIAAAQFLSVISVSFADIFYFILFFILGFLLYSSIFTIIGAICSTEQDAQQLQMVVVLPLIIPLLLMFFVSQNPNNIYAVVLSMIPLFTPMLMLTRVIISEPSIWEILLSIGLLLATIYGVIIFSSRVFRVGILMYGKRPGLREVLRWFRYA